MKLPMYYVYAGEQTIIQLLFMFSTLQHVWNATMPPRIAVTVCQVTLIEEITAVQTQMM